jgi:acetylornithine deacetylase/succinyl-diaminopimelate desuccinylase-like protein
MARTLCALVLSTLLGVPAFPAISHAQAPSSSTTLPSVISSTQSGDLAGLENDAMQWFVGLLKINTSNPPGNEIAAAKYLAGILDHEGIRSEVFETTPGRGFIVARLSATAVPDPSRALLLLAHLDVVGIDKTKWTVDPFGAQVQGNYLYGRGTIDDKGMVIADLATLVELKRTGARLNRDVIFLAEPDEEAGATAGMKVIVEKYWDKIAAGYALNEGGLVVSKNGKVQEISVQASEKISMSVDVIAKGTSGHASIPRPDNPVSHLAAAITKIAAYEAPVQFNAVTRAYFGGLAAAEDDETAKWMRALETPDRGEHAARWISSTNPTWNAMLRDTIAPTMLQAGIRNNVVPSEARGVVNIRLLPENRLDPLLGKLTQLVNDPQIRFETEAGAGESAPSSSLTSDLYKTITQTSGKQFPGVPVVPYMSTWATDSSELRLRNVQAYGLVPFPLTDEDAARMHGDDERIPVDSFHEGIDFLYAIVSDFAVSK